MEKNSQNFSMQEAMRLANSDAGKQLLALLKQSDKAALQQAMSQVSAGDYSSVPKTLASILASPEIRSLLKEMEEKNG